MAGYPREPTQDEQIRRMQEQIRRLMTRMPAPAGAPVEAWQSLSSRLATGWVTGGTLNVDWEHARFYKDRERVYFAGNVQYLGTSGLSEVVVNSMPTGYVPAMLTNLFLPTDPDNTPAATKQEWWMAEALPITGPGRIAFDQNKNFMAAPNGGYPPELTHFALDGLSYRVS